MSQRMRSVVAQIGIAATLSLGVALVAAPGAVAKTDAVACAAQGSEWLLRDIDEVAAEFFPHLLASYPFADASAFAGEIAAVTDKNEDGLVCAKLSKGYDLNPKSHWYRLGWEVELKGGVAEPIHYLRARDNLVK